MYLKVGSQNDFLSNGWVEVVSVNSPLLHRGFPKLDLYMDDILQIVPKKRIFFIISDSERLECPKRAGNLINRKISIFCFETIPRKHIFEDTKHLFFQIPVTAHLLESVTSYRLPIAAMVMLALLQFVCEFHQGYYQSGFVLFLLGHCPRSICHY